MAVGLSPAVCASLLDALFNQTNYTAPTALWMQLHTGDPGAAGTSNVATETDRVDVTTLFSNSSGNSCTNSGDITWTGVAASEDFTHWSIHSASTAGSFYQSGLVTANAVTINDNFTIPAGDFDHSFSAAA